MVANRSAARGDALAELLRARTSAEAHALAWEGELSVPPCDILVDCTPVGMGRGRAALEVVPADLSRLEAATLVCDLNPDHADTAFLRMARAAGHRTLGGLPMLARQGAAGFEAWTGIAAPVELLEAALARTSDNGSGGDPPGPPAEAGPAPD